MSSVTDGWKYGYGGPAFSLNDDVANLPYIRPLIVLQTGTHSGNLLAICINCNTARISEYHCYDHLLSGDEHRATIQLGLYCNFRVHHLHTI